MPDRRISLAVDPSLDAPARHGVEQLSVALAAAGHQVVADPTAGAARIVIARVGSPLAASELKPPGESESYALGRVVGAPRTLGVIDSDGRGVMYGCFELAEQIANLPAGGDVFERLKPKREKPDLAVRRLHTFLHNTDLERPWFYSREHWEGCFDLLARSRYNEFNLVFGHQTAHLIPVYAYMFELDGYRDVRVEGLTDEERARNLSALQMISRMATERGVTFWIGIWQSKPWASNLMGGQQALVQGLDGIDLADYTLKGIVRLLALCPDIAGIQLRMNSESGLTDQGFFRDVFIPGLKECGRDVQVEVRNWGLRQETLDSFVAAFPGLRVSFKYFAEHQAMSYQPVRMRRSYSYDSLLRKDRRYQIAWHVWNLGTHRLFLWGDPDFVKCFARSCHLGDGLGFEITPPLSQKGFSQFGETKGYWSIYRDGVEPGCYEWEYQRYWFFYELWGRIGYNHELGNEVWLAELARRFGPAAAPHMFDAYREGSQVVSYLISHHMDDENMYNWLELDAGGYIDYFGSTTPGEKTLFLNARDYARRLIAGERSAMITPFQAAEDLEGFAERCEAAMALAGGSVQPDGNEEFRFTHIDMDALCALARYNAQKTRASAYLYLFYETADPRFLDRAEERAQEGKAIWERLTEITEPFYDRLNLGPTGGHWRKDLSVVENDIERIRAVRGVFERYGAFEVGLHVGERPLQRWRGHDRTEADADPVEPRFARLAPEDEYDPGRGFGWLAHGKLEAVGPGPIGPAAGRGATRSEEPELPNYPTEFLHRDRIGSREPATLRVDVPDGRYELTFAVGNSVGEPRERGTMSIRVNGESVLRDLAIPAGRIADERVTAEARDGALLIELAPGSLGEWLLSALTVTPLDRKPAARRALRVGGEARGPAIVRHDPVQTHAASDPLSLRVAVERGGSSDIAEVRVHYRTVDQNAEFHTIPMRKTGKDAYSVTIPAEHLDPLFDEMYYFEVVNKRGGGSFYPEPFKGGRYFVVHIEA